MAGTSQLARQSIRRTPSTTATDVNCLEAANPLHLAPRAAPNR
ncbi:hypothetical protein I546_6752 [Mycobacterium kansasii 732]|nr:hypothetical protein I546_6752 [Mycobacterium kansasii 732]